MLDDATSAVDATTEEAIHATLRELMADRTTILIAHRRSTLRLAHRIVVLDAGRAVAEGTHEELLLASGVYRDLFAGPDDLAILGDDDLDGEGAGPTAVDIARELVGVSAAAGGTAGVTAAAWPTLEPEDESLESLEGTGIALPPRIGPPGGGGGAMGMALTATPKMLAVLETLPPGRRHPPRRGGGDGRTAGRRRSGSARYVRPWMWWLGLGLLLVALDTLLTLFGPALVSYGIDQGVSKGDSSALWRAVVLFAVAGLVDWAVVWAYTAITGRTAERMLYGLRVKIFAHLQRLSLDYYDSELDGRIMTRMTTDVEALVPAGADRSHQRGRRRRSPASGCSSSW